MPCITPVLRACSQVMNAQLAGAVAAIVYDDFYESLIIMSMPKGHTEPDIPSVFVTERSGFILTKLLEVEGSDLRVRIMPVRPACAAASAWEGISAKGMERKDGSLCAVSCQQQPCVKSREAH